MKNNLTERLNELWWSRLPLLVGRWWKAGAEILSDGMYLLVCPPMAAWAPVIAIVSGLGLGIHREGACNLYTCSIWSFRLLYLFGGLGAGLGIWASLGYILADFLLGGHWVRHFLYRGILSWLWADMRVFGGLIVADSLLVILVVGIPFLVKRLRPRLIPHLMYDPRHQKLLEFGFECALLLALLYLWTQCFPILVRPMYWWVGGSPPVDAIATVQQTTWKVLVWAMLLTTGKRLLEMGLSDTAPVRFRQVAIENLPPVQPKFSLSQIPWAPRTLVQTVLITFFMGGIINDWWSAGIFSGGMFLFLGIRYFVLGRLLAWRRFMSFWPLVVRVALGAAISFGLSFKILERTPIQVESFFILVILFFIALLVFSALVPETLGRES